MTGTNCIYYERNKDLCVPGKREQWWRRHDGNACTASATEGHRPEFACSHERSQQQWFWRGGFMVHLGNLLVLPHGLGQQRMG